MKNIFVIDLPPTAFETLEITDTAKGANAANVANAKALFITVETANIRYRIDGTAPTANVGHLVNAGENIYFACPNANGAAISQLKMIRQTGNNATVQITFY